MAPVSGKSYSNSSPAAWIVNPGIRDPPLEGVAPLVARQVSDSVDQRLGALGLRLAATLLTLLLLGSTQDALAAGG